MNLTDRGSGQSQALGLSVNYSPEFDDSGPNTSLLRRLAELGGGQVLNPESENPFSHDRKETFQPLDMSDWLLKLAILLFPLDVGVRRIQIDRAEWLRAMRTLRRWLMPWRGVPRTKEADESLSALLTRRGRVRSERTAVEPSPALFEPESQCPRKLPIPAKPRHCPRAKLPLLAAREKNLRPKINPASPAACWTPTQSPEAER